MLADSTRYPLINGNLGVFRFWVARTYIIPVVVPAEGQTHEWISRASYSPKAANVAGPLKIQLDRSRLSIREMLQRALPAAEFWLA